MYESAAPEPPPTTEFNVLGPLTVVVDGDSVRLGGPRQVAVLGRLVLSPGHVVSMDQLVDSVWDGDAPSRPEVTIRSYVSNLRRSIEPARDPGDRRSCIESSPPGYRLNVDRSQIDAFRFEGLLAAGQAALAAGDPASATVRFDEALSLWRGEVGEGMVESDALLAYRSRLTELRLAMIELSSTARLALGELEGVIADLESAIALHPLRERLTELAMLALYRAGRQSDALAACRDLRTRLLETLGVTPGRPIEELEHRILVHDPTLLRHLPDGSGNGLAAAGSATVVAGDPGASDSLAGPVPASDGGASITSSPAGSAFTSTGRAPDLAVGAGASASPVDDGCRSVDRVGLAGRDEELRTLGAVAHDLAAGRGRTVVVTGESGIGKTALVEAFTQGETGARVVWGRCRPIASDLALWPWGQVLDGLAAIAEPDILERIEAIVDHGPVGDAGPVGPSEEGGEDGVVDGGPLDAVEGVAASGEPPGEREEPSHGRNGSGAHGARAEGASLFRPIVGVLRTLAERKPLIVVVDDAHWADPSSIELLAFAATSLADTAIAFVVVWREPTPGGPAAGLRALGRPPNVVRIPLSPLDRMAVEDLLERRGIGGGTLAARILAETAGNASFVTELIADIGGAGDETSNLDPTGGVAVALRPTAALRDRVLDRLEEVDDEAETILTVAAIHGPGFTGDVLAEIVELPAGRVDEALERLVGAGLVIGEPGAVGYRFTHPIVAKALSSKLSSPRRARLHTAVGHALWRRGAPELVLARHFSKAGSPGTSVLAARFALAAGRDHAALDDLFEVEEIVRSGLEAMGGAERSDVLAAELSLALCQIARIRGQRSEHRRLVNEATRAAELADDPRLAAAAVLGTTGAPVDGPAFGAGVWAGVAVDRGPDDRRRLAELLRAHGPRNPLSFALALRIARAPHRIDDQWSALDTTDIAALLTVRPPDDTNPGADRQRVDESGDVLAHVELARLVLTRGDAEPVRPVVARFGVDPHAIDRGRMATILDQRLNVERSTRQRGHERLLATHLRLVDGFDRSDPAAIDAVVDELAALPSPGTAPGALDLDRFALEVAALLPLGELGQVERRLGRARHRCQRVGIDPVAFDRQMLILRWIQGKLDDPRFSAEGRSAQLGPVDELAIQALAAVGRGDVEPARALIEQLADLPSWASVLADPSAVGSIALAGVAAAQVGDESVAAAALQKLGDRTGQTVSLWGGLVLLGPGCLLAGMTAAAVGDHGAAGALLADSEARCRAVGARAWLRQTLVARAGLAAASGDRSGADRLWAESVELATEMVTGRQVASRRT